jgi:hypothetical protein
MARLPRLFIAILVIASGVGAVWALRVGLADSGGGVSGREPPQRQAGDGLDPVVQGLAALRDAACDCQVSQPCGWTVSEREQAYLAYLQERFAPGLKKFAVDKDHIRLRDIEASLPEAIRATIVRLVREMHDCHMTYVDNPWGSCLEVLQAAHKCQLLPHAAGLLFGRSVTSWANRKPEYYYASEKGYEELWRGLSRTERIDYAHRCLDYSVELVSQTARDEYDRKSDPGCDLFRRGMP